MAIIYIYRVIICLLIKFAQHCNYSNWSLKRRGRWVAIKGNGTRLNRGQNLGRHLASTLAFNSRSDARAHEACAMIAR